MILLCESVVVSAEVDVVSCIILLLGRFPQNGSVFPAFASCLDFHAFKNSCFDVFISHFGSCECAMCAFELEWTQSLPHFEEFGRWERDHVGYGPHECKRCGSWRSVDVVVCRLGRWLEDCPFACVETIYSPVW